MLPLKWKTSPHHSSQTISNLLRGCAQQRCDYMALSIILLKPNSLARPQARQHQFRVDFLQTAVVYLLAHHRKE